MKTQDKVKITDLKILRQTDLAVLFKQNKIETWLPRSQISYMKTVSGVTEIEIPEWLAYKTKLDWVI